MDIDQTQVVLINDIEDDDIVFSGEKKPAAHLRVLSKNNIRGRSYPLYEGDNIVGRGENSCQVSIPSQSLSKEHACIQIIGNSHLIFDKSSLNKTRRGKLVLIPDVRYELKHRDQIFFADIECFYEILEQQTSVSDNDDDDNDDDDDDDDDNDDSSESEIEETVVLAESDSDESVVRANQQKAVQETLVVELSDEESADDFTEMDTQDYTGIHWKNQPSTSLKSQQKGGMSQQASRSSIKQSLEKSLDKGSLGFQQKKLANTPKKVTSSSPKPLNIAAADDSDYDEDEAAKLFALSTLAYDVTTDVIDVDNDSDAEDQATSDVEIFAKDKDVCSSNTADVACDATVAIDVVSKKLGKVASRSSGRLPAKVSATSSTQIVSNTAASPTQAITNAATTSTVAVTDTEAIDSVVSSLHCKKVTASATSSTQAVTDTTTSPTLGVTDTVAIESVATSLQPKTTDFTNNIISTQTSTSFVPDNEKSKKLVKKRGRKSELIHTNTDANNATVALDNTLPLTSTPHIRGRRQNLKSSICENDKQTLRNNTEDSTLALDLSEDSIDIAQSIDKPVKTNTDKKRLKRIHLDDKSDKMKKKIMLESTQIVSAEDNDSTQPYEADAQHIFQCIGDTQNFSGNEGSYVSSQDALKARLSSLPQASQNSSDDSDIEESFLLKTQHTGPSKPEEVSTDGACTLAYDMAVDMAPPTLAYDITVDMAPPTLAYDMAVDASPTLAYDLSVEERPKKKTKKSQALKLRKSASNSPNLESSGQETVTSLPKRSPLKSALVDRRRSPSPASKHVMFAVVKEHIEAKNKQKESQTTSQGLTPQDSDTADVAGVSTRTKETKNKKLSQSNSLTNEKGGGIMENDNMRSTRHFNDSKKKKLDSKPEEKNKIKLGNQKKFNKVDLVAMSEPLNSNSNNDRMADNSENETTMIVDTNKNMTAIKTKTKRGMNSINKQELDNATLNENESLPPPSKQSRMSVVETPMQDKTGSRRVRAIQKTPVSDQDNNKGNKLSSTPDLIEKTARSRRVKATPSESDNNSEKNEQQNPEPTNATKNVKGSVTQENRSNRKKNIDPAEEVSSSIQQKVTRLRKFAETPASDSKAEKSAQHEDISTSETDTPLRKNLNRKRGIRHLLVEKLKENGQSNFHSLVETEANQSDHSKKRARKTDPSVVEPNKRNDSQDEADKINIKKKSEGSRKTDNSLEKMEKTTIKMLREIDNRKGTPKKAKQSKKTPKQADHSVEEPLSKERKRKIATAEVTSTKVISEDSHLLDTHRKNQQQKASSVKIDCHSTNALKSQNDQNEITDSWATTSSNKEHLSHALIKSRTESPVARACTRKAQSAKKLTGADSQTLEQSTTRRLRTSKANEEGGNSQSFVEQSDKTVERHENTPLNTNSPGKLRKQPKSPVTSAKKSKLLPVSSKSSARATKTSNTSPNKMTTIPKVMLTGFTDEQAEKIVQDLGGEMAASIEECTHLITDRICRTVKFLSGLAKGFLIVSRQWLSSCKEAGTFLDGHKFLLSDAAMEKQYNFKLATSIKKAQDRLLMAGYKVHVTESVKPDPAQMKGILLLAGAEFVKAIPKKFQENTVVISCLEDHKLCLPAIKAGIPIVSAEFVLTGILRQELDLNSYALFKDDSSVKTTGKGRSRRK